MARNKLRRVKRALTLPRMVPPQLVKELKELPMLKRKLKVKLRKSDEFCKSKAIACNEFRIYI
tara:strand:+ start:548 stop:736 length:189 start_codon:yes stop_codon:yes gene_type:complete